MDAYQAVQSCCRTNQNPKKLHSTCFIYMVFTWTERLTSESEKRRRSLTLLRIQENKRGPEQSTSAVFKTTDGQLETAWEEMITWQVRPAKRSQCRYFLERWGATFANDDADVTDDDLICPYVDIRFKIFSDNFYKKKVTILSEKPFQLRQSWLTSISECA